MQRFKWLHLSDLHFQMCEGFDMNLILDQLKEILKEETAGEKFRYIFLTGDLADRSIYSMVEQRVRDLLLDSGILEDDGTIIWVCGNHDIPRTLKHRKNVIRGIRDKEETDITFENEFADQESRKLILGAFSGFYKTREVLFGIKAEEGAYPHQVIHTDDLEIVMLNTCLTSCDDEDEHKLYLCESELIGLFHEVESGKPVFVLGHHSLDFIADEDRRKLQTLFLEKNVSLYLCGHSHQLGVKYLSENMLEVVSGGFKNDGHAIVSFLTGIYDGGQDEYELIPYTYRFGSRKWGKDYEAVQGVEPGKKYKAVLSKCTASDQLSDLIARLQKLFRGAVRLESLNTDAYNKIGEGILRSYVQMLSAGETDRNMGFEELCENAMKDGNKNINYTSLRMSQTMKDIWRFRENAVCILNEIRPGEGRFPKIPELNFEFQSFFETVNRFDVTENAYVLVTDAVHDMDDDRKKVLTEFPWDMILDYDGHSETGGLRSRAQGRNIKDLLGSCRIVRESVLRRGITSWVRIGEQMKFVPGRDGSGMNFPNLKDLFMEIVDKLYENTNGTVLFVYLKEIEAWDRELMRCAWDRFAGKARFVLAGAYDRKKLEGQFQELFRDEYGRPVTDCYRIYQTSAIQFMTAFSEYSENFMERKKYERMLFPTNTGLANLEENLYVNLGDYFEVLTSDIGTDLKHHHEDIEEFYLGGEAKWSLFYTKDILDLLGSEAAENLTGKLKTALGAKKKQPKDAIFYLLHSAGFGGTTAARAIAWRLHRECPTLILKSYEYGKIKPLIQNLYDNHSRKGILIIADENRFSISDLEKLEWEIGNVDRPFALLIVKRLSGKNGNDLKNTETLTLLTNEMIAALQNRFEERSHLDSDTLRRKKGEFNKVFPKNSGMRCPFLIGLYYQDEKFNGIKEYVKRIVDNISSEKETKLLLILAVINYYGRIGAAKEIVEKYVPLPANANYLEKYPYAKDAFIRSYDETLQVRLYCEKHPLISLELIKQCSQKLYGANYQENLKEISEELIEKILEINQKGITLYYKNLLERLFVYKNAADVDEKGYTDVSEFSPLILALPSQTSKEEVMCSLAAGVKKVVENISPRGNELYFKMAAHICGHLGRLYKASTVSLESMKNSRESIRWCENAETIMKKGGFEDAYIYHMYGTSLSKQCQDAIKGWNDELENCSAENIEQLEADLEKAISKFDEAIYAGEFVRGCISKLSLLMEYMKFLMKWKKIGSADELQKLSAEQRGYIRDIDDMISMLDDTVLDGKDRSRLLNLQGKYKSEIIFNNYGKAIEYYTNSIDNIVKKKGEDAEELYILRSGLASSIIGKYFQNKKNPYLEMEEKDVARILEALEKNIFSTVVLPDRWEHQRRCNDCYRWLRIAKQSTTAVRTGIKVAEKWKELQKEAWLRDPRPYYYMAVLNYLDALDGYEDSLDIARANHKEAYRIANNNSDFRVINMEMIRDILVTGKGMNRLKSVVDLSKIPEEEDVGMVKLRGKFLDIDSEKNKKIGIVRVSFPREMRNLKVYFKMGDQNTIGIGQTTHTLEFGVGFTFERLEAVNRTVKDVTSAAAHSS